MPMFRRRSALWPVAVSVASPPSRGRATERQSVLWNGLTDSGQPLPAGGYLVTLTARTDDGQTARVIRPIQILR